MHLQRKYDVALLAIQTGQSSKIKKATGQRGSLCPVQRAVALQFLGHTNHPKTLSEFRKYRCVTSIVIERKRNEDQNQNHFKSTLKNCPNFNKTTKEQNQTEKQTHWRQNQHPWNQNGQKPPKTNILHKETNKQTPNPLKTTNRNK